MSQPKAKIEDALGNDVVETLKRISAPKNEKEEKRYTHLISLLERIVIAVENPMLVVGDGLPPKEKKRCKLRIYATPEVTQALKEFVESKRRLGYTHTSTPEVRKFLLGRGLSTPDQIRVEPLMNDLMVELGLARMSSKKYSFLPVGGAC